MRRGMLSSYLEGKRRPMVSHDELAVAIVLLLVWGFGMAALVLN
jgi:hypothetical protein